jgi:hemerythrin-like domain-containing protein
MSEAMRILRQEHANMAMVLDVLERQLALFDQAGMSDFKVIRGVLDYFLTYPDLYHHPKEDLIYHQLRARDKAKAAAVGELLSGHEDLALLTRRLARATVDQILEHHETPQVWFRSLARAFLDANRHHMAMEERHFFPLALQVLTPEDWAEIDRRITDREDPLFGIKVETQFQSLHQAILVLERTGQAPPSA